MTLSRGYTTGGEKNSLPEGGETDSEKLPQRNP